MAYERQNFKPGMILEAEHMLKIEDQLCENVEEIAKQRMDLNEKQTGLVSGVNIKTINNQSILGEGNIDIRGIVSIEKTSTEGLVDTYTITFTDGTTTTFTITNGEGSEGSGDGQDGITPHIGANGNWWIGEEDTGVQAQGIQGEQGEKGDQGEQGEKGDKGDPGESAYEIAQRNGFEGTEEEWLASLKGEQGGSGSGTGGTGTVSWNDLTDRPFYDESVTLEIVESTETETIVLGYVSSATGEEVTEEFVCVKLSDDTPEPSELLGGVIGIPSGEELAIDESAIIDRRVEGESYAPFVSILTGTFFVVYEDDYASDDGLVVLPKKGIYGISEGVGLCLTYGSLKKLDKKYLPDDIGELPEVTTDDNGKFLRVIDGAYALVALTDVSVEGA